MGFNVSEKITVSLDYKDVALISSALGSMNYDGELKDRAIRIVNRLGNILYNCPQDGSEVMDFEVCSKNTERAITAESASQAIQLFENLLPNEEVVAVVECGLRDKLIGKRIADAKKEF